MKIDKETEVRFWHKVRLDRGNGLGCWEWVGAQDEKGYGSFRIGESTYKAHRIAWMLMYGDPEDCVLHRCDNPPCVRPTHLFAGSVADNNRDRALKGRSAQAPTTVGVECNFAKLNDDAIREIRAIGYSESQEIVGARYGVTGSTICNIRRGRAWKHVTGGVPCLS